MKQGRFLPIGIQDFEDLCNRGCVYVDKTDLIFKIVKNGKPYFWARPRSFGKSLLISTLDAYFSGKKDLFKGLAIEQLETEWIQYPIIKIDFTVGCYPTVEKLQLQLDFLLGRYEKKIRAKKRTLKFVGSPAKPDLKRRKGNGGLEN